MLLLLTFVIVIGVGEIPICHDNSIIVNLEGTIEKSLAYFHFTFYQWIELLLRLCSLWIFFVYLFIFQHQSQFYSSFLIYLEKVILSSFCELLLYYWWYQSMGEGNPELGLAAMMEPHYIFMPSFSIWSKWSNFYPFLWFLFSLGIKKQGSSCSVMHFSCKISIIWCASSGRPALGRMP